MNFLLTTGVAKNCNVSLPMEGLARFLQRERERERERERDEQAYIVYTFYIYARIGLRVEISKKKSFKSYFPVVVFIGLNDETGFFYSQKQIQTNVAGVNFHRRPDCVVSLREERALCNPPFL
jgi:hypothetical protein